MALTFTPTENQDVLGARKSRVCTAEIASYTTGGEAVTDTHALELGLRKIERVEILDGASDTGNVWSYSEATEEILVYESNSDAADGPLQEAGSTDDVGEITVRVVGF